MLFPGDEGSAVEKVLKCSCTISSMTHKFFLDLIKTFVVCVFIMLTCVIGH